MAKVFESWGIQDTKAGFDKLAEFFNAGLNAKEVSTKSNEYGTTVTRELSLMWASGEKKGESAGSMLISYFYKDGNMNTTPEISTVIPKN